MSISIKTNSQMSVENPVSLSCSVIAAFLTWFIFNPGVFSADSMYFIYESTTGLYSDWHSPFLAFILALIPAIKSTIGIVILAQIAAGWLGIRRLAIGIARFMGVEASLLDRMVSSILILFSLPLSPLPIYLSTLWTDTWLAVFLVWIMALLIELYLESRLHSRGNLTVKVSCAVVLIAVAILIRSNSLVIYPALSLCLWIALRPIFTNKMQRFLLLGIPLALFAIFIVSQYKVFDVKRGHAEHAIYALDLASMIVLDPTICQDLSLLSCDLVLGNFSPGFVVGRGAIDFTMNQGHPAYVPYYDLMYYPGLENEFVVTVRNHPMLFAEVKLLNFLDYIGPDSSRYFFQENNHVDDQGFVQPRPLAALANQWFSVTNLVVHNGVLFWFSFVHSVWLIINILGFALCGWHARWDGRAKFLGLILLIPLSYYASYLIAFTSSEFRFMYPSMLVVQVITLTALCSFILNRGRPIRPLGEPGLNESVYNPKHPDPSKPIEEESA